jgi:hypothetical protein
MQRIARNFRFNIARHILQSIPSTLWSYFGEKIQAISKVSVHLLVTGKLVTGKLVTGKLVTGKLVTGKRVIGKLVTGKLVTGKYHSSLIIYL